VRGLCTIYFSLFTRGIYSTQVGRDSQVKNDLYAKEDNIFNNITTDFCIFYFDQKLENENSKL
jgi:hypothetical protein